MNEQYDSDGDEADQREARRLREEAKAERADEMRDREKDERNGAEPDASTSTRSRAG